MRSEDGWIEATVGNVATPSPGDLDLAQAIVPTLVDGDPDGRVGFRCGNGCKETSRPAANDGALPGDIRCIGNGLHERGS